MNNIFHKYKAEKKIIQQFNNLNNKLKELMKQIHKLDDQSYSFRYPVKNDGVSPIFDKKDPDDKSDVINFEEMKKIYDDSIFLIKFSTDVVNDIIVEYEKE